MRPSSRAVYFKSQVSSNFPTRCKRNTISLRNSQIIVAEIFLFLTFLASLFVVVVVVVVAIVSGSEGTTHRCYYKWRAAIWRNQNINLRVFVSLFRHKPT